MTIREAYNDWSLQYDTNVNKTRDLEGIAIREMLQNISFTNCLEIGCGTGKNTVWLQEKTDTVLAVDLSEEMMNKAKEKVDTAKVTFQQADITKPWTFANRSFDLVSFSLVLEHISNIDFVFSEASKYLQTGGYLYLGELHPFKQYAGSKARFETEHGTKVIECYTHNVSEFVRAGLMNNLSLVDMREYFDEDNAEAIPRILAMIFVKM